jgi:hypothetical protein
MFAHDHRYIHIRQSGGHFGVFLAFMLLMLTSFQESVADAEKSIKVSLDAAVGKYTASASASSGSSTSSSEKNIHETKIGTIDRKVR